MTNEVIPGRPGFRLFVLGMHRSGTSVTARLINLLGLSLGLEDELIRAADDDLTVWECQSLTAANDELLLALGGEWSAPPRLEDGWQLRPELDALRRSALETLERVFPAEEWAWKDPRNCLTLPFWLALTDQETAIVIVYRNPLEVAASLCSRDGLSIPLGLALWERYTRSALAAAHGHAVHVASYESLVADPAAWCAAVSDFLSRCGVATSPLRAETLRSLVQPDLRHSTFSERDLAGGQRDLYMSLQACEGSHDAFAPPNLPPETPWLQVLFDERRRCVEWQRRAEHAEARQASIEASRSWRMTAPLRRLAAAVDSGRPTWIRRLREGNAP